ncbi:Tn3 family transposase [Streptosporangium roseum]|uniref:Tn3 family transposase n=1 Tax=Streptosporangium roseum TaxID=2001 RepID=UPI003331A81B
MRAEWEPDELIGSWPLVEGDWKPIKNKSGATRLQAVLRDPDWAAKLTDEDRRALSPLFWAHVNPYGRFRLDMDSRLDLGIAVQGVFSRMWPQPSSSATRPRRTVMSRFGVPWLLRGW